MSFLFFLTFFFTLKHLVKRANESLANVTSAVQEASKLKNLTASLQKELQRNMSALEEKLKRARESVAKVKGENAYVKAWLILKLCDMFVSRLCFFDGVRNFFEGTLFGREKTGN